MAGQPTEILQAPAPPISMSMELPIVAVAVAAGIMLLIAPVLVAIVIAPILLTAELDCISMIRQEDLRAPKVTEVDRCVRSLKRKFCFWKGGRRIVAPLLCQQEEIHDQRKHPRAETLFLCLWWN